MSRSIFIGDVHGCVRELAALLSRLAVGADDQTWFVGDLVGRGPDPRGVLRLVREIRGQAVRGNHEERLLEARAARRRHEPGPRLNAAQALLYASLSEEDWEQLTAAPYTLAVPEHGIRVAHAGLVPGVALEAQAVAHLTRLRSIRADGTPSDRLDGTPWAELWRGPEHVVFGHDALSGLQLHEHATGLDTGCVYGGRLTAFVLPRGAPVPPPAARRAHLVDVTAAERYFGTPTRAD